MVRAGLPQRAFCGGVVCLLPACPGAPSSLPAGRAGAGRLARLVRRLVRAGVAMAAVVASTLTAADDAVDEVVLEAELCRELTFPWQPIPSEGASGGLALALPEGAGSSEAYADDQEGDARFALPNSGSNRTLWLRLYWNGNCSNSLFVSLPPDGQRVNVADHVMRSWHWVMVPDLVVSPWHQEVILRNREDGVWVGDDVDVPGPLALGGDLLEDLAKAAAV